MDIEVCEAPFINLVETPYNVGVYGLPWTPVHMYGCLYYNPLGSRSEQGRPEGPILRV